MYLWESTQVRKWYLWWMNAINGIRITWYFRSREFVKYSNIRRCKHLWVWICAVTGRESKPVKCKNPRSPFLQDPSHDIQQLHRYAAVAKLFIDFNTTLPSSAHFERLFSAAGQILLPRWNRLQDGMFEILLFWTKTHILWLNWLSVQNWLTD